MFGIDLLSDDEPLTGIDKYFDDLGYFAHRDIVYEARKGTLKEQYPTIKWTQREVLEFAFRDKEENYAGASYNALAGAENLTSLIGEPETNPFTGEKNTEKEQAGFFSNAIDGSLKAVESLGTKAFIGVAITGGIYLLAKKNKVL